MKIGQIKPNPNNPRLVKDDKFSKLVESIKSFGEKMMPLRPMVIDENNILLGGNMRYKALKELGYKEVPDSWVKQVLDLTEEEKQEFIIKDNVGFGAWDWDALANEWDTDNLEAWGLDIPDFEDEVILEAEEDDYEEPEQMNIDIVEGDLVEFICTDGRVHRLLCGDSTDSDAVAKLMNGEKADMAHNDPPYGMKKEKDGVANDNLNYDDLLDFNKEWISLQFLYLKPNGSWYCWGIDEPLMDLYYVIIKKYELEKRVTFRNLITWNKGSGQGQNSKRTRSYATADEKCLFVAMGVMGETINGCDYDGEWDSILNYLKNEETTSNLSKKEMKEILGENMYSHYMTSSQFSLLPKVKYQELQAKTGLFKKPYESLYRAFGQIKESIRGSQFYFDNTQDNMNNVWHFQRTGNHERETTGGHATPKPIELCDRAIKSSCPPKGLVLDFFLGSGSTMVATSQLNRTCYGMELTPKYCQVIIDRMMKLDDSIKVKINGKDYEGVETPF